MCGSCSIALVPYSKMDNAEKMKSDFEKRRAQRAHRRWQEQQEVQRGQSREAWLEGMENSPPPETKKTTNVSFVGRYVNWKNLDGVQMKRIHGHRIIAKR